MLRAGEAVLRKPALERMTFRVFRVFRLKTRNPARERPRSALSQPTLCSHAATRLRRGWQGGGLARPPLNPLGQGAALRKRSFPPVMGRRP